MSIINLLPDDYLKRRSQRRSNIVCMALFAVIIAGVIGANAVTSRSEQHTLEVCDRVNEEYAKATVLIQHMQSLETQKAVMLDKAKLTASLVERMPRSTVLGIVTIACPKGVSLEEVSLLCKPVAAKDVGSNRRGRRRGQRLTTISRKASGPPEIEVNMTISGLAETDMQVAKFIANLASSRPLITEVNLVFSQEKLVNEKVLVREFEIRLQLAPDVDAIEIVKGIVERASAEQDAQKTERARRENVR